MTSRLRGVGRAATRPLVAYFDHRFADLHARLEGDAGRREEIASDVAGRLARLEQRLDRLEASLTSELVPLEELLVVLQQELREARREIDRADARSA